MSIAKQRFGLTKRTCHFVKDIRRRRTLYLTLVRSLFEHCSPIWSPTGKTIIDKLENFQKKCIKWVLSEENISYNDYIVYLRKCKQVDILPLAEKFKLNDLIFFHKILYELIPIKLPEYLVFFSGKSRLRSSHLDSLSIVNQLNTDNINPTYLNKSFFFRTYLTWNNLPLEIRQIVNPSTFKKEVTKHMWKLILMDISEEDDNWLAEDTILYDND